MKIETLPDLQSSSDARQLAIQAVGVKDVQHPTEIRLRDGTTQTVAGTWSLNIHLEEQIKGTHMSRFIELLTAHDQHVFDNAAIVKLGQEMLKSLAAEHGRVRVDFPIFMRKHAPVSGVGSWMDYQAGWRLLLQNDQCDLRLRVAVPVKSLCPCSKEISKYGAHNQRSLIVVEAQAEHLSFEDLIEISESQASCQLWGVLKRPDEKYVTERAYENPKFVEDLVRDVATELINHPGVGRFSVEAENFESIHNHNAFAKIST